MYQVIARKYRPQVFSELLGQEHVRTTLSNAIAQRRIAHGYILSGQRGTGKTTVARIIARCLNCEQGPTATPCMQCASCREVAGGNCVDVIEIDAASNRGINEMRELRENVRYRPARDRYKVFIIDEAHQITSEAFNALLKTLEEPPEWVVFVLCTTETHKIPTTIASRCQQFSFRGVDYPELVARMEWICGQEGITADAETLGVIAQVGEGSVRDSLSALDQAIACCGATLEAQQVRELLGLFSLDMLGEITRALSAQDSRRMIEIVQELERNGRNLQHFCRELARYFRNLLVAKLAGTGSRLIPASQPEQDRLAEVSQSFSEEDLTRWLQITLELYRELQYSLQPKLHLELGLLRLIHAGRLVTIEQALANLDPGASSPPPRSPSPPATKASMSSPSAAPFRQSAPPPLPPPELVERRAPSDGSFRSRLLVHLIADKHQHLADAAEECEVTDSATEASFSGPAWHAMAVRDSEMKAAVQAVAGRPMRITFIAVDQVKAAPSKPAATALEAAQRAIEDPEVKRFQEMFPGSQVRTVRDLRD